MTEHELLELAAKALGSNLWHSKQMNQFMDRKMGNRRWNPLTDDGDALRLAFVLKIAIEWQNVGSFPEPSVEAYRRDQESSIFCASEHENDYRRAIVSAAAQIGKTMP